MRKCSSPDRERGIETRSGWKPTWTAQEPPSHQPFPLPKQEAKELVVGPRVHQRPPRRPQRPHLPQCSAFPAQALKIHVAGEQAGCSRRGPTSLRGQRESTRRGVFKGVPPASQGGPVLRPRGGPRPPGVAGYFWVWRGRGAVRGTGNWGAGVGKSRSESSQPPSPLSKEIPAP